MAWCLPLCLGTSLGWRLRAGDAGEAHDVASAALCCAVFSRFENLQISGTDGQTLIIYHADPGSRTEQALALLATLAADRSPSGAPTGETGTGAEPSPRAPPPRPWSRGPGGTTGS